ncbi:DUF1254 domain-containing protein [Pedosphaera parvula]|uniref:DUF1254 domain-containing protein n=1 Tax=Pedosphaera parvula (strain Ellin514) TaxID=320771 RepID=B9XCM5_PEDPL|nr:DUF1254 domain-containing protein [Pedosphaera parvula]EEF62693.1 protein of unknown function DUF1254 [Pedosphaera parvula Ellin514]
MKTKRPHWKRSLGIAIMGLAFALTSDWLIPTVHAQEKTSDYTFKGGYPTSEAAQKAHENADFQRAVTAYRFWYPTVSCESIFNGNRANGFKDNESFIILSAGPRQVGFTLNSDTPYGSAAIDLKDGPMVIELPPGSYIGLVNDHNQGWVMDMGIPGPDAGKGGKHIVLPPGYDGIIPDEYHIGRSKSLKNLVAIRALPEKGDVQGAMNALRAVKIHPFSDANPRPMAAVDVTGKSLDVSCLKWEDNMQFWEVLHKVINSEPLTEEFRPMYGLLSAIGIEKGKPFAPDARMKGILERAAKAGRDQMLVAAFASARPDRMTWPDRKWEWIGLVPGSAQFETPSGMDLEARDRWFAQAIVTSPAMFRRSPGAGSLYWLGLRDSSGAYLDGGKSYKLTVPQPVPAKLFWSVTVYDAQTRSEVQTDQDKAALRSMFELKDVAGTAPVDLYFGPTPLAGQKGRWIKTVPGRGWFAYFRIYGPESPAFDGSWKPGDFEVQLSQQLQPTGAPTGRRKVPQ